MKLRAPLFALLTLLFAAPALAREQINLFDSNITVERDGDIVVTETINVTAEGDQIRRGIFRDLPRFYQRVKTLAALPKSEREPALLAAAARR